MVNLEQTLTPGERGGDNCETFVLLPLPPLHLLFRTTITIWRRPETFDAYQQKFIHKPKYLLESFSARIRAWVRESRFNGKSTVINNSTTTPHQFCLFLSVATDPR